MRCRLWADFVSVEDRQPTMEGSGAALSSPGRLIVTALLGSGERHAVYLSPNTRSSLSCCCPPAVGATEGTTTDAGGSVVWRNKIGEV